MIKEYLEKNPCAKNCAIPCNICVNFAIPKIVVEQLGEEKACLKNGLTAFCSVFSKVPSDGCTGVCDAHNRFELREQLQVERRQILGIHDDVDENLPF